MFQIAKAISERRKTLFFTGAGISTESGIPDYRGKGGVWRHYRPIYFNDFMTSVEARIEYWRRKHTLLKDLDKAIPNQGHLALNYFHQMGLLNMIVTQNVDGLHQKSGVPEDKIIELHGNTTRVRCMSCGELYPLKDIRERIDGGDSAPECHCGGYLKTDTISFGQSMPMEEVNRAYFHARNCDFFCVIGSTLLVQPAAQIPQYAKSKGAFLSIINLSETPCDNICDVLIREKAGDALSRIMQQVSILLCL